MGSEVTLPYSKALVRSLLCQGKQNILGHTAKKRDDFQHEFKFLKVPQTAFWAAT